METAKSLIFAVSLLPQLAMGASLRKAIPEYIALHVAQNATWSGIYSPFVPITAIGGFSETDRNLFLTIATGPEYTSTQGFQGASFNGFLLDDQCSIEGPVAISKRSFSEKYDYYQTQTKIVHECLQMRVTDTAGLLIPENNFCKIEPINEAEAIAKGGVCYFGIQPHSQFQIRYELDPKCLAASYLNEIRFTAGDISAFTGYYISGDTSGRSPDLTSIGATTVRISTEPSGKNFPLSTNMGPGVPLWPARYNTDFHAGELALRAEGIDSINLSSSLFVDNSCPRRCTEGVCESTCDYSTAFGAQLTLSQFGEDDREHFLDMWFVGQRLPAQWQGFFKSTRSVSIPNFKLGTRLRLTADLTHLTMYHNLFREGFQQILIKMGLLRADPNSLMKPLPPIGQLETIKQLSTIPQVPSFPLLGSNGVMDYSITLNHLRSLIQLIGWPPYYTEACFNGSCSSTAQGGADTKVGIDFTVGTTQPDGSVDIENLRVWRKSTYLSNYSNQTSTLLHPQCR